MRHHLSPKMSQNLSFKDKQILEHGLSYNFLTLLSHLHIMCLYHYSNFALAFHL